MHWWGSLLALTAAFCWPSVGWSIIVDPARPITHRVNVQIIETALTNGTSPATVLGNAAERADIESLVDAIWAQAGIDINFLQNAVRYNDTFAYQGNVAADATRPVGDLNAILGQAKADGNILHPDDSVLNLFMVDVVPGFSARGESWGGGLANVGSNGITMNLGKNLLSTAGGRESVATLVAHEIGHNLGLRHITDGTANLMATRRASAQLSDAQIDAVFQWHFRNDDIAYIPQGSTGFLELIPEPLAGDFTRNGIVDAADFSLWRSTLGSKTSLAADANGNAVVDQADYNIWKSNYGHSVLPQLLPGDYNDDGVVDSGDYSLWRDSLGSITNLAADGNRNLVIDQGDYSVWKSNFGLSILQHQIAGDYNGDREVDAADYSLWRDSLGSVANLAADGNGNGIIDRGDYEVWKSSFSGLGTGAELSQIVPEPSAIAMLSLAWATLLVAPQARRRRAP